MSAQPSVRVPRSVMNSFNVFVASSGQIPVAADTPVVRDLGLRPSDPSTTLELPRDDDFQLILAMLDGMVDVTLGPGRRSNVQTPLPSRATTAR